MDRKTNIGLVVLTALAIVAGFAEAGALGAAQYFSGVLVFGAVLAAGSRLGGEGVRMPGIEKKPAGCLKLSFLGCGGLVGLVFLVTIFGTLTDSRTPAEKRAAAEESERSERLIAARVNVRNYVTSKMKSPSTAVVEIRQADYGVDGKIRMVGHVDAQNSFGATVRNQWIIELSAKPGGDWNVDTFEMVPQ